MPQNAQNSRQLRLQASLSVLLLLSIISAIYYLVFLLDFSNISNLVVYSVLLVIELYVILQTIGTWWTSMYVDYNPRTIEYHEIKKSLNKTADSQKKVAVFITVYGEPIETIRKTALAAKAMHIEHEVYILDDGESDQVKALTEQIGVNYIRRLEHKGKKAGNVNNALKQVEADFVAIFDADHVPKPNFLLETLPFLLADDLVAFVQTPQNMTNRTNMISIGSSDAQDVFYELVSSGKNKFNAMFWVGTNALFRKSAFDSIGGVIIHPSEDILTAYTLHERGWKSIYIPTKLTEGEAPDRLDAYLKQQLRWAGGGFHLFFDKNPLFSKLNLDQKFQYFLTSIFYFGGLVTFLMMTMPLLFLYFGIKPIETDTYSWLTHYVPFFLLQFVVVMTFIGKLSWESYILSINTFPAHIKALWLTLIGKEVRWSTSTGSFKGSYPKFDYTWPHITMLILNLMAFPVGLISLDRDLGTTIMSLVWCSINIISYSVFLYQIYKPETKQVTIQEPKPVPATKSQTPKLSST